MNDDRVNDAEKRLVELAAVSALLDPVPPEAIEAANTAFVWCSVDAELADLVFDSAMQEHHLVGVRSDQTSRQLTFEAPELAVELEYDHGAECPLVGQLVPAGAAEIEICSAGGSVTVQADDSGRFWARELPGLVVSFRIRQRGDGVTAITTPWVSLLSSSPT